MNKQLRLLAVHAHPDDESSKGAATVAKYLAEGVEVLIVTATGGERGDILNPNLKLPENYDLLQLRKAEMQAAIAALGCQHQWLGFIDSGYPEGDPKPPVPADSFAALDLAVASEELIQIFRNFKPDVVITYDENGGYPHPDHIRTHEITMFAYEKAKDPTYLPTQEIWQVPKIYYHQTFSHARVLAFHQALQQAGIASPYEKWLEGWEIKPDRVTTKVNCANYFFKRDQALIAHATQVDPQGQWFAMPRDIEREVWPTEDYELAINNVGASIPEVDLFNGLRS